MMKQMKIREYEWMFEAAKGFIPSSAIAWEGALGWDTRTSNAASSCGPCLLGGDPYGIMAVYINIYIYTIVYTVYYTIIYTMIYHNIYHEIPWYIYTIK